MYAFEALLYVLGIYLGIHPSPDNPTVSFIAFLLAVPLLFVMRPIQHILNVVFFDGIFILTCFLFKSKETLPVDILDGMVFGAVSCIISTFIMLSMHENFSIRHKLLGIAETDLNVGLKNRNAYESQMHDYPMHCSSTLSCVYLDVNGLHELNNTRGHAAGDEMLKTVAAKVRDIFGEEYSYRVGGDEFVAFAMDKSAEEMRALIHKLVQEVDEAGYSVAVGTATHSAGGIDMEVLVKSAETRMYLAKEEHYRLAGKTRG